MCETSVPFLGDPATSDPPRSPARIHCVGFASPGGHAQNPTAHEPRARQFLASLAAPAPCTEEEWKALRDAEWPFRSVEWMVFAGGGNQGCYYVGALEALEQLVAEYTGRSHTFRAAGLGCYLRGAAGSSVGAVFALMLALGCTACEIRCYVRVFEAPDFTSLNLRGLVQNFGMHKTEVFRQAVRSWLLMKLGVRDMTFAELWEARRFRLIVCVTNVSECACQYLDYCNSPTMSVVDAVMGSISVPLVFEPLVARTSPEERPSVLVDGGMTDNFPVKAVETLLRCTGGVACDEELPFLGFQILPSRHAKRLRDCDTNSLHHARETSAPAHPPSNNHGNAEHKRTPRNGTPSNGPCNAFCNPSGDAPSGTHGGAHSGPASGLSGVLSAAFSTEPRSRPRGAVPHNTPKGALDKAQGSAFGAVSGAALRASTDDARDGASGKTQEEDAGQPSSGNAAFSSTLAGVSARAQSSAQRKLLSVNPARTASTKGVLGGKPPGVFERVLLNEVLDEAPAPTPHRAFAFRACSEDERHCGKANAEADTNANEDTSACADADSDPDAAVLHGDTAPSLEQLVLKAANVIDGLAARGRRCSLWTAAPPAEPRTTAFFPLQPGAHVAPKTPGTLHSSKNATQPAQYAQSARKALPAEAMRAPGATRTVHFLEFMCSLVECMTLPAQLSSARRYRKRVHTYCTSPKDGFLAFLRGDVDRDSMFEQGRVGALGFLREFMHWEKERYCGQPPADAACPPHDSTGTGLLTCFCVAAAMFCVAHLSNQQYSGFFGTAEPGAADTKTEETLQTSGADASAGPSDETASEQTNSQHKAL